MRREIIENEENIVRADPDKIIPNKHSLSYPVQIGDQKIVVPDNNIFRKRGLSNIVHYYETRVCEIKEEYDRLIDSYNLNKRIYESNFKFEPILGHTYHLYRNYFGEEFLSLISPDEWNMDCIGSYRLCSDERWGKVK